MAANRTSPWARMRRGRPEKLPTRSVVRTPSSRYPPPSGPLPSGLPSPAGVRVLGIDVWCTHRPAPEWAGTLLLRCDGGAPSDKLISSARVPLTGEFPTLGHFSLHPAEQQRTDRIALSRIRPRAAAALLTSCAALSAVSAVPAHAVVGEVAKEARTPTPLRS